MKLVKEVSWYAIPHKGHVTTVKRHILEGKKVFTCTLPRPLHLSVQEFSPLMESAKYQSNKNTKFVSQIDRYLFRMAQSQVHGLESNRSRRSNRRKLFVDLKKNPTACGISDL